MLYPPRSDAAAAEEAADRLRRMGVGQPAVFIVEYALAQLWMSWGLTPAAVVGHSLGASGLVSVVLNCRMHRESLVPANVQTRTPLPGPIIGVMLSSTGRREIRRSLCISAGFGGALAAVSLVS